ncbi:MAG: peptide-methionine (S)-S-oxide reductase MsrA [Nanoarchaeota archaeon]
MKNKVAYKTAMFGAGCFWGVEEAFRNILGVVATEVGYAGGDVGGATYEQVCLNKTGHAEVVLITFDPSKVQYKKLLDVFWRIHDPTQLNRQGPDVGAQYRSVIFYFDNTQKKEAEKSLNETQKRLGKKIATVIDKAGLYIKAEDYHQKYLMKHGRNVC